MCLQLGGVQKIHHSIPGVQRIRNPFFYAWDPGMPVALPGQCYHLLGLIFFSNKKSSAQKGLKFLGFLKPRCYWSFFAGRQGIQRSRTTRDHPQLFHVLVNVNGLTLKLIVTRSPDDLVSFLQMSILIKIPIDPCPFVISP